ncbi:MAG: hypothetical protein AB9903_10960 [Vulcanimicrobiota bacterium]
MSNVIGHGSISGNYHAEIKDKVDTAQDLIAYRKYKNVEDAMKSDIDRYIPYDNSHFTSPECGKIKDMCPESGKMGFVITIPKGSTLTNGIKLQEEMTNTFLSSFDPNTKEPLEWSTATDNGYEKQEGRFDENGKLVYALFHNEFSDHTETLELKHDKAKGIIYYDEKYEKL